MSVVSIEPFSLECMLMMKRWRTSLLFNFYESSNGSSAAIKRILSKDEYLNRLLHKAIFHKFYLMYSWIPLNWFWWKIHNSQENICDAFLLQLVFFFLKKVLINDVFTGIMWNFLKLALFRLLRVTVFSVTSPAGLAMS